MGGCIISKLCIGFIDPSNYLMTQQMYALLISMKACQIYLALYKFLTLVMFTMMTSQDCSKRSSRLAHASCTVSNEVRLEEPRICDLKTE